MTTQTPRKIAIIGAGQAGLLLGAGLLDQSHQVTIYTNRDGASFWNGKVMSSQFIFDPKLQVERDWKMNQWEAACPNTDGISFAIPNPDGSGTKAIHWYAPLYAPGQAVDQRVKYPGWMDEFVRRGGKLSIVDVGVAEMEELAGTHDLVLLAGGKGEVVKMLSTNAERSPVKESMRKLALTYVTGMKRHDYIECVNFNLIPGVGEYFVFPSLTTGGPYGSGKTQVCDIMVLEGVNGGPMDRWHECKDAADHLQMSLDILKKFLPWEYERSKDCQLTDDNGILAGRITPTVRNPVLHLPSGRKVMGLGDAVIVNDPVTGQGSNNATWGAKHYFEAIMARGNQPFDEAWMNRTFDELYNGYAEKVVRWTNSLLLPPPEYIVNMMGAAQGIPALASRLANGFNDPTDYAEYWFDAAANQRAIEEAAKGGKA
ncbi:MAG: FAD-binding oxidoreductase [Proteobacteria bacterium]|nr:FAD-binding oxidoreductase [Pseudomonadota bacterium]